MMRVFCLVVVCGVVAVLVSLPGTAPAQEQQRQQQQQVNGPSAAWVAPVTEAVVGQPRMLAVRFQEPVSVERTFDVQVEPAEVLEVLGPLRVLAGEQLGWVRVRPLRPGEARVSVVAGLDDDDALGTCRVRVVEAASAYCAVEPWPRVKVPARGAVLWGEVRVAAVARTLERPAAARLLRLESRGADVAETLARTETFTRYGEEWLAAFSLDAATQLEAGSARLAVEFTAPRPGTGGNDTGNDNHNDSEGVDQGVDFEVRCSEAVPVRVAHPAGDEDARLVSASAVELARLELPEQWREAAVQPQWIAESTELEEGGFVVHPGAWPPSRIPFDAGEDGAWVQMSVLGRGSTVAGIGPRMHLMRNQDTTQFPTHGHLVEDTWHRVPVGEPVWLEPGRQWLASLYSNDYAVEGAFNRYLFLARLELLEVPDPVDYSSRIALATPLEDGVAVHGSFELVARLGRGDREALLPPETVLELNGRELSRQRSEQPRVMLGTKDMRRGNNELRLWLDDGHGTAIDEVTARFRWDGAGAVGVHPDGLKRLTAAEPGWRGEAVASVAHHDEAPDGRRMVFTGAETARIALPASWQGRYDVRLFMQGHGFDGSPVARVRINDEDVGRVAAQGWWHAHVVAEGVELEAGDNVVEVALANPHGRRGEGRRTLLVSALEFRRVAQGRPEQTPTARFVYPVPEQGATASIARTDAVVVDVRGAAGIIGVQVQLNGEPVPGAFHLVHEIQRRADGRICIPFTVGRELPAGRHQLQVAVIDRFQRFGVSNSLTVRVVDDSAASPYAEAVHLLNRFGYGPEPDLLATMLLNGPHETLNRWLTAGPEPYGKRLAAAQFPRADGWSDAMRVLDTGLRTRNPVRFRVSEWLLNHFSVFINELGGPLAWEHWRRMEALGAGRFADALRASATSPAMMRYLDNFTNHRGAHNENYARELLELHTLGVDQGYDQQDVQAVTLLLSGWGLAEAPNPLWPSRFAFHPRLNEESEIVALGYRFEAAQGARYRDRAGVQRERGEALHELLLAHPATAQRIARRLAASYVSEPVADELVDKLAEAYHTSYGDLARMLGTLAESEAFMADAGKRITDPLSYAYRVARCGGASHAYMLAEYFQAITRTPLTCDMPDGFELRGSAYLDSSNIRQRWRFAEHTAEELRHRLFHGAARWENPPPTQEWLEGLLDCLAVRLLGKPLSQQQTEELVVIMQNEVADIPVEARIGLAITLLAQLPEANLH